MCHKRFKRISIQQMKRSKHIILTISMRLIRFSGAILILNSRSRILWLNLQLYRRESMKLEKISKAQRKEASSIKQRKEI